MCTFVNQIQTDPVSVEICKSVFGIDMSDVAMDVLELCPNVDELQAALRFRTSPGQLNCSLDIDSALAQLTGYTRLEYSTYFMAPEDVLQGLANGADASYGAPVALAAWCEKTTLLKPLLDAGADINAAGSAGFSALHWACYYANLCTLDVLVQLADDKIDWHARTRDRKNVNALQVALQSPYWNIRPSLWRDKMFTILREHGLKDEDEDDEPLKMPGGLD